MNGNAASECQWKLLELSRAQRHKWIRRRPFALQLFRFWLSILVGNHVICGSERWHGNHAVIDTYLNVFPSFSRTNLTWLIKVMITEES